MTLDCTQSRTQGIPKAGLGVLVLVGASFAFVFYDQRACAFVLPVLSCQVRPWLQTMDGFALFPC